MVDHIRIAREYVQEQLETRDDIVGALVVGSVARGEAVETSDIDLTILVEGGGEELQREGTQTFREGVCVDVELAPAEVFADAEKALRHRFFASYVNDAVILYDPTGQFACAQKDVRAVYTDPAWVAARVRPGMASLRKCLAGLRAATGARDQLGACVQVRYLSFWLLSVPLVIKGITPSSTRAIIQLESVAPDLKDQICVWQGSAGLDSGGVEALLPIASECLSIGSEPFAAKWGEMTRYVTNGMAWNIERGRHREALYDLWFFVGDLAGFAHTSDDAQMVSETEKLVQDWLRAVGWEGQEVLEEKVRMAEEMVAEVEAMAAHLPADEGAKAQ